MIKRYMDTANRGHIEWPTGEWVWHEDAAALESKIAELQSALDVQSARSDALAAELARYSMPAGEADQRMAESRAVRQALGFGQDADDVAPVDLVERINALEVKLTDVCAENAALKKFIREKCFVVPDGASCFAEADECAEKRMPETPSTDAWVNEQRAVGAEMCVKALVTSDNDSFEDAPNICSNVAAQLRGAENVPVERLLLNKLQEGRA
ncbi:hypothetical protein V5074_23550 [Atlantibacter hermannii]|uniref:hypothetical protein n=1 Tax=Atlantibacter hermannii TaxID=565 RepID=UPI0030764B01